MSHRLVYLTLALLIAATLAFSGCSQRSQAGGEGTIEITDMAGRTVEVPEEVDRVVGVGAGSLRLITYLNATHKVVGVEDFEKSDHLRPYIMAHPELTELPSIGPQHGGDAELIAAQDPDVIFWTYTKAGDADNLQQKTGIPVVVLEYGRPHEEGRKTFYDALRLMGDIINKEDRAEELIQYMNSTIQDLNHRTKDISEEVKPAVYVGGVAHRGAHGIVSTEPAYAPFEYLDARNVAGGLGLEHAMVSREKLTQWNPDIIFVDRQGYSLVEKDLERAEYHSLDALKDDKMYGILPYNYYTTNYATVVANAYYIGKVIYPESFSDIDPQKKANEIYTRFVGKPVYEEMENEFGGFGKLDLD
ncbi:MAG: iron ABC transporter substrate-binding protein [Archaeoglobaceae archaeon]